MKWDEQELERLRSRSIAARLISHHGPGWRSGYIHSWSSEWILLKFIGEGTLPSGYDVVRRTTIKSLLPDPYGDFLAKALQLRRKSWPGEKKLDKLRLDNIRTIIESVLESFPLLVIHSEKADPDVCFIGREATFSGKEMTWLEVGPDGIMESEPSVRNIRDISRIGFAGLYEQALWMVAKAHRSGESSHPTGV